MVGIGEECVRFALWQEHYEQNIWGHVTILLHQGCGVTCVMCLGNQSREIFETDSIKILIAGLIRYHYPVSTTWVSEKPVMGHFTTVGRAMRFYDGAKGK